MAFANYRYETDNGSVVLLRVDEELDGLMGTPPEGAVTLNVHGIVNGNRGKEFGIHPRGVRLYRSRGTAPDVFKSYKFLPVLTREDLDGGGFDIDETITISSVVWTISDQISEDLN
jgi:hypothetical protein